MLPRITKCGSRLFLKFEDVYVMQAIRWIRKVGVGNSNHLREEYVYCKNTYYGTLLTLVSIAARYNVTIKLNLFEKIVRRYNGTWKRTFKVLCRNHSCLRRILRYSCSGHVRMNVGRLQSGTNLHSRMNPALQCVSWKIYFEYGGTWEDFAPASYFSDVQVRLSNFISMGRILIFGSKFTCWSYLQIRP